MIRMIGITERGDAACDLSWLEWVTTGNPAILITKNPEKLQEHLGSSMNVIVHCTITGFGGTVIEPHVPEYQDAIKGFEKICSLIGKERVVLRIDPIVPTTTGIATAKLVKNNAPVQTRVRVSFLDIYKHVKQRFKDADVPLPYETFHAPFEDRKKAWKELGQPEVCSEPGFECTGCVSAVDCEILGVDPHDRIGGQRFECKCLMNKKELLKNRKSCPHKCLYCYWQDKD